MPTNQALQIFYGTVPLILVVVATSVRRSMLLEDIVASPLGTVWYFRRDQLVNRPSSARAPRG